MRRNAKEGAYPGPLQTVRTDTSTVLMPAPCPLGAVGHKDFPAVI